MARRRIPKPKGDIARPDLGQELGLPSFMPVTTWEAFSADLGPNQMAVGRDPLAPSIDELVLMLRRDGFAQAMLNILTLPIRAVFAKSQWVSPDYGDGEKEAEFANLMWTLPGNAGGMQVSASLFLRQTLLAMAYGFSTFEVVKNYRDSGPLAGKFVIDKMAYRDPRTVTFLVDDHGNFNGLRQKTFFAGKTIDVVIQPENAWYFAANEERNPLYGVSYFEPAFQHFQIKRKLYYIGDIAAQLAAVPGRIGEIPFGASTRQIDAFKKQIAEFTFKQAIVVPPNFKLTPFNGNSNFDITKLIDHHTMQMAISILAKFLQMDDRQVLIDNGKADASADMFVQLLTAVTTELSELWTNKLMPQFIDYNFGTGIYPVHKFAPLTDENKQTIYDLFNTIVGLANINCTPEFVRSTEMAVAQNLGYKIDYNKVADEEEQIAQEQQKFAEQAQQQQAQAAQQAQQQPAAQPKGPQGANAKQRGVPSPAPTLQGGRPPTKPRQATVKASEKQLAAMETIALALNDLIEPEDVPEDYFYEPEVVPEAQDFPLVETDDDNS